MDKYIAIKKLYPNMVSLVDFELRDEGNGVYISKWPDGIAQPTDAELQAAYDQALIDKQDEEAQKLARKEALKSKLKIDDADLETLAEILRGHNS